MSEKKAPLAQVKMQPEPQAEQRDTTSPDLYHAAMVAEGAIEPRNETEYLAAWQTLVDTGLVWKLQGWFGRTAMDMIRAGVIHPASVDKDQSHEEDHEISR
jgi:hypothetical protein